jgi:hypothetical protein
VSLDHLYSQPVPDDVAALYISPIAAEVQRRREVREANAERVEVIGTPVDQICAALRSELSPDYQEIWDADNKVEYHRTGRRKGKSHYLIRRKIAKTLRGREDTVNPYILPTLKSVTLVIWPLMKQIVARHFRDDARISEVMRTIQLPVGGRMVCGGCETKADAKNWFGMAFNECTLDECGNYPDDVLVQLADESLEPSLMDFGGDLVQAGNPGLVLKGRWYDQTKDGARDYDGPLYTGDARSNPFLAMSADAYFESVKRKHRWSDTSPTYRRQYLGEWVEDSEGLVFPFTDANMVDALPLRSRLGGTLPPHQWRYVIGVDVGYVDSTGIAVLASHPLDNREYVVRTEKHPNWLPDQLAHRLKELRQQYGSGAIVMDTGGMGKVHAMELTRKWGMAVVPAEKRDKASAVRVMRDDIRSERLMVIAADNEPLLSECSVIGWDEDKRNPVEGLPDDCTHAAYYAHRYQRHYGERMAEPAKSQAELDREMEDAIIARRLGTARQAMNRAASLRAAMNRR